MKSARVVVISVAVILLLAPAARAQLVRQSELGAADVDPSIELSLEQISEDLRWMGLSPRDVTWSADGEWVYFRWNEAPAPGQLEAADPWFAVDAAGTRVRPVDADEAARIPGSDRARSAAGDVAAWTRDGTVWVWTPSGGTRAVFSSASSPRGAAVASDGSRVTFATDGSGEGEAEGDDLWAYELAAGHVRQIAVVEEPEPQDPTDIAGWLRQQQLDLLAIVRQRKDDREAAEAVERAANPNRPQSIVISPGDRATDLQLSPDGRFLTFRWIHPGSPERRTEYMEFVSESGQNP